MEICGSPVINVGAYGFVRGVCVCVCVVVLPAMTRRLRGTGVGDSCRAGRIAGS